MLKTPAGKLAAGLVVVAELPAAIGKVRSARRGANRAFVATRETVRMAGRVMYGPLWGIGETVLTGIGGLFRHRNGTEEERQARRDRRSEQKRLRIERRKQRKLVRKNRR